MDKRKAKDHRFRSVEAGFTLVELIVVIVLIGIMTAIAIPSLKGFSERGNVISATNDLVSALNLARSEAVSRAVNVTVCKTNNQTTCQTSGNWDQGWVVFVDVNGDNDMTDAGETVLRVFNGPGGSTTMVGSTNVANRLTYSSTGFFAGAFDGTITVTSGGNSRQIIANVSGRVRTQ